MDKLATVDIARIAQAARRLSMVAKAIYEGIDYTSSMLDAFERHLEDEALVEEDA